MICTPTLLVDEKKCRDNIRRMAAKASANELIFRPHFKTHQSHQIGNWFREEGVTQITVSSLTMAKHFANDGWKDITVAFPVNVLEIDMINELSSRLTLNLLVESVEAVEFLNQRVNTSIDLFIKIDVGTHRTGISTDDIPQLKATIERIETAKHLTFRGFLGHAGHSYSCRGKEEIMNVHADSMKQLAALKNYFPDALISYGDTPTCSIADSFEPADELRPGNFAFYDLMQLQIGSCRQEEIAVAMACPVVAKHPERNEVVIYGGGVHFSKDRIEENGSILFGKVVKDEDTKWGEIMDGVRLVKVSQEHGIIRAPTEWIASVKLGDLVKVLPVHSCLTMDLLRDFQIV